MSLATGKMPHGLVKNYYKEANAVKNGENNLNQKGLGL